MILTDSSFVCTAGLLCLLETFIRKMDIPEWQKRMVLKFFSLYMRLKIIFYFLTHGVILSIFFLNQAKQYPKGLHIQPNSASSLFFVLVSLLL
jgi:hypothetical protein